MAIRVFGSLTDFEASTQTEAVRAKVHRMLYALGVADAEIAVRESAEGAVSVSVTKKS